MKKKKKFFYQTHHMTKYIWDFFFRWIGQQLMIIEMHMSPPENHIFGQKWVNFFFDRTFYASKIFYEVENFFLQLEYYQKVEIFFLIELDKNWRKSRALDPPAKTTVLRGGYVILAIDNLGSVSRGSHF